MFIVWRKKHFLKRKCTRDFDKKWNKTMKSVGGVSDFSLFLQFLLQWIGVSCQMNATIISTPHLVQQQQKTILTYLCWIRNCVNFEHRSMWKVHVFCAKKKSMTLNYAISAVGTPKKLNMKKHWAYELNLWWHNWLLRRRQLIDSKLFFVPDFKSPAS